MGLFSERKSIGNKIFHWYDEILQEGVFSESSAFVGWNFRTIKGELCVWCTIGCSLTSGLQKQPTSSISSLQGWATQPSIIESENLLSNTVF